MKKCRSWEKYKGLKEPTCDGGIGCQRCNNLYIIKLCDKIVDANPFESSKLSKEINRIINKKWLALDKNQ